jgi:hypothetical protein
MKDKDSRGSTKIYLPITDSNWVSVTTTSTAPPPRIPLVPPASGNNNNKKSIKLDFSSVGSASG